MNKNQEPPKKKVKVNALLANQSNSKKYDKLLDNWDRFDFRVLDVEKIYKTRSAEIQQVLAAIAGRFGPSRVFQSLPRHLRRRGMSHNPYLYRGKNMRAKAAAEIQLSAITQKKSSKKLSML